MCQLAGVAESSTLLSVEPLEIISLVQTDRPPYECIPIARRFWVLPFSLAASVGVPDTFWRPSVRSEPFLRSEDSAVLGSLPISTMVGIRWRLLAPLLQGNGLRSAATATCVLHGVEAMSLLGSVSTPSIVSAPPGSLSVGPPSLFHHVISSGLG
jgi:hypothetical protein